MTDLYDGVVGLDPSLVQAGIGRIYRDGSAAAQHYGRKGKRNETIKERGQRLALVHDSMRYWIDGTMRERYLVVIEGPSYGSKGGSAWDRAGLWWRLIGTALAHEHDVVLVSPRTRAKWATGNGNADKKAVWATVPTADCDGCADATVLARMGAQAIGWYQGTQEQHSALTAIEWPELVAERVLKPYVTLTPHE